MKSLSGDSQLLRSGGGRAIGRSDSGTVYVYASGHTHAVRRAEIPWDGERCQHVGGGSAGGGPYPASVEVEHLYSAIHRSHRTVGREDEIHLVACRIDICGEVVDFRAF